MKNSLEKNSLEKQTLKLGVIAIVLAAIIPVLAQELLSSPSALAIVAAVSAGISNV
jgi:hypothetical protein